MEDYRVLFRMKLEHEYFEQETAGIMEVVPDQESSVLLRKRQLIFRRETPDQWCLIGNVEGGGVDGESDRLKFEFRLKEPAFGYYTKWDGYDAYVYYKLILSEEGRLLKVPERLQQISGQKKKAGILFHGVLDLKESMYEKARENNPVEDCLRFESREMIWEYLFIPRSPGREVAELLLEEQEGKVLFTDTELVGMKITEQPVKRCLSQAAVKMKNHYSYRLDLWETIRNSPDVKRKIVRNVEYPVPGQFHDLKGNYLRRIVYF